MPNGKSLGSKLWPGSVPAGRIGESSGERIPGGVYRLSCCVYRLSWELTFAGSLPATLTSSSGREWNCIPLYARAYFFFLSILHALAFQRAQMSLFLNAGHACILNIRSKHWRRGRRGAYTRRPDPPVEWNVFERGGGSPHPSPKRGRQVTCTRACRPTWEILEFQQGGATHSTR